MVIIPEGYVFHFLAVFHFSSHHHHLHTGSCRQDGGYCCCWRAAISSTAVGTSGSWPWCWPPRSSTTIAAWPSPAGKKAPGRSWAWRCCPAAWCLGCYVWLPASGISQSLLLISAAMGLAFFGGHEAIGLLARDRRPKYYLILERGLLPGHFGILQILQFFYRFIQVAPGDSGLQRQLEHAEHHPARGHLLLYLPIAGLRHRRVSGPEPGVCGFSHLRHLRRLFPPDGVGAHRTGQESYPPAGNRGRVSGIPISRTACA